MGAKTCMLVYADGAADAALKTQPKLDREATTRIAQTLFPEQKLREIASGKLWDTNPPDDEIFVGHFSGAIVVAAREFGIDYPSKLPRHFLEAVPSRNIYFHAMHSVVDWFAFAQWSDGKLVRSLSVSWENAVIEELGQRLPFEEPYWSGQHPAFDSEEDQDDSPLPFHPLDLGEAALRALFGYQLEGDLDASLLDPESIELLHFKRYAKWKFWR